MQGRTPLLRDGDGAPGYLPVGIRPVTVPGAAVTG